MNRMLRSLLSSLLLVVTGVGAAAAALPPQPPPAPAGEPSWAAPLRERLEAADRRFAGDIGVFVQHLGSGEAFSFHADEPWYLASGIKVVVAIAVLQRVEAGDLSLETRVRLRETDFVDGAGQTNSWPAGTRLRVSYLLEQMIVYSDNTATDVLIRTVGEDEINVLARALLHDAGLTITTLADVRRLAYAGFHPHAADLTSQDLLALQRAPAGPQRVRRLAELLHLAPENLLLHDLDSAFEAYYATNVNAASLRDYARMLEALAEGRALGTEQTRYLLDVMTRVRTGDRRIKAALPAGARFAHKTGTQYRRVCDLGIVTVRVAGANEQVVVAACARGAPTAAGERALRDVGAAVAASGVLKASTPDRSSP